MSHDPVSRLCVNLGTRCRTGAEFKGNTVDPNDAKPVSYVSISTSLSGCAWRRADRSVKQRRQSIQSDNQHQTEEAPILHRVSSGLPRYGNLHWPHRNAFDAWLEATCSTPRRFFPKTSARG